MHFLDQKGRKVIKPAHTPIIPRKSCYAVIKNKGSVLLVRSRVCPEFWQFPGGGVEEGESISQGLKREILEETGLKIEFQDAVLHSSKQKFYANDIDVYFDSHIRVYLASSFEDTRVASDPEKEIIEKRWVPISEISQYNMHHNMLQLSKNC